MRASNLLEAKYLFNMIILVVLKSILTQCHCSVVMGFAANRADHTSFHHLDVREKIR